MAGRNLNIRAYGQIGPFGFLFIRPSGQKFSCLVLYLFSHLDLAENTSLQIFGPIFFYLVFWIRSKDPAQKTLMTCVLWLILLVLKLLVRLQIYRYEHIKRYIVPRLFVWGGWSDWKFY